MAIPAAAITAAAALASTGANMIQTGKLNKKGRAFTYEQNEMNRQQTWDMWNATNDFNLMTSDPAFQMQRWKDAGLNPHLMYGNPQDVKASNMGTQQFQVPEQKGTDFRAPLQDFLTQMMQKKQIEAIDANIKKTDAETTNTQTQTANTDLDIKQKTELFPTLASGAQLDNANKSASNQKIINEISAIGKNMEKTDQEIKNMQSTVSKNLVEIENLRKQGKVQEAQEKSLNLANQLFQATMPDKIKAQNAENQLIQQTGGVGKASVMQMPAIILGKALDIINNTMSPSQRPKLKEAFKRDLKFKD